MSRRRYWLTGAGVAALAVYLLNASWLAPRPSGEPMLVAHRGVHQTYDRTGLDNDTCTATRIHPPTTDLIENTMPSMLAGFAAGADMLELDVHPTKDGEFAVFHDWTIDCRTEGKGVTREQSMAYLRTLDVGHGYTADGGKTYPLRGKGIGMMPTLAEVLRAFPDNSFLINFKSRDASEGDRMADYLAARGLASRRLSTYGHERPVGRLTARHPEIIGWSRSGVKSCALRYMAIGWTGYIPEACRNTWVPVPLNYQWAIWGWPNRFQARLASVGSKALLVGDVENMNGIPGIERVEQLRRVPKGFGGALWIEAIEIVGPAMRKAAGAPLDKRGSAPLEPAAT